MKPQEIFGIIIRVFGLSLFIYAIWYLVYGVATIIGFSEGHSGYKIAYFISGFTFLLLSLYFLRGAPLLLRYSYPKQKNVEQKNPGD